MGFLSDDIRRRIEAYLPRYPSKQAVTLPALHIVQDELRCVPLEAVGDLPEPLADSLPVIDPEQLQQALNELPEVFRTPIILYYFEDFTYRNIAEQMDLPLGTVMSRLARAKSYLRSRLLAGGQRPEVRIQKSEVRGQESQDAAAPAFLTSGLRPLTADRRATDGL